VDAWSLFAGSPGVNDVGDGECAGSRFGADDLGAEDACQQDHGRVRSAVSVPMAVQHYFIVPANGLFSLLVAIRPVLLPKSPLSVCMAGALASVA
jgi:hypothetical protein